MHAPSWLHVQNKQNLLNRHVDTAQVEEESMSEPTRNDGPQGFRADLPLLVVIISRSFMVQTDSSG